MVNRSTPGGAGRLHHRKDVVWLLWAQKARSQGEVVEIQEILTETVAIPAAKQS
ncbi:MAG: hypothetical protein AAFW95_01210 [Cyanobacteria bacterium J06638_6]